MSSLSIPLRPKPATAAVARKMPRLGWLEWCVITQSAMPALLFVPGMSRLRFFTRVASFVIPLICWAAVAASGRRLPSGGKFPAVGWGAFCATWYVLSIAHPQTNTLNAGLAEAILSIAILCPVFWAAKAIRDARQIGRLIVLLLICNGAGAVVGVAQVYRPDTFNPPEIALLKGSPDRTSSLSFKTEDGRDVLRPCGLTDSPGGAGVAGSLAFLTGIAVALRPIAAWKRLAALAAAMTGLTVIYLSMARSTLLILVLGMLLWGFLLAISGEKKKLIRMAVCAGVLGLIGTAWALRIGGGSVSKRFLTLFEDRLDKVYYNNRGFFVIDVFTSLVPEYPLGAGMGRVGMIYVYFGDPTAPPSRSGLYCEIQLALWMCDGGLPLLIGYSGAIVVAITSALGIVLRKRDPEIAYWAGVVVIFGTFNVIACFGSIPFIGGPGVQFWALMGALYGAEARSRDEARRRSLAVATS